MDLNYTDGCVNFRDAGEFINLIARKEILPRSKFYRGSCIDYIKTIAEIANPKSIFNLRNGVDPYAEE